MTVLSQSDLKRFANSLSPKALTNSPEDHARYVAALHQSGEDQIKALANKIDWNSNRAGVYLFTGMPGTGKTTELYRLASKLEEDGHLAFFIDGLDYISPNVEIEIGDFLIGMLLGFADQLDTPRYGNYKLLEQSYASRFKEFLNSEVGVTPEIGLSHQDYKAVLRLSLRNNPAFKKTLQTKLQASLAILLELISDLVNQAVAFVETKLPSRNCKIVLLIDSLEKVHGDGIDGHTQRDPVLASLKKMVSQYANELFLSGLHIVYSVPPYLLKLAPMLGNQVDYVCHLTSGHILQRRSETPDPEGLAVFHEILEKRFPEWASLLKPTQLDTLILNSGGDLREFFRLVDRVISRAAIDSKATFPVPDTFIESAIQAQRRDYLPLPGDAKSRLRHARQHFEPNCDTEDALDMMVRDLYLRRLLIYRNGEDWYMPHPLLWQELTPPAEK